MTVSHNLTRPTIARSVGTDSIIARARRARPGRLAWNVVAGLALLASFPAPLWAQHVHGVIDLGVVIEGDTLAVSIDAPLSDVVGFEHEPAGDEQVAALQRVASILADGDSMFGVPGSAECSLSDTAVEAPAYLESMIAGEEGAPVDHSHEEHAHHHDHDHSDAHAELNASYQWTCGEPSELDALALTFIESFAGVETVRVQLLTAGGAQVMNLTGSDSSLPLNLR